MAESQIIIDGEEFTCPSVTDAKFVGKKTVDASLKIRMDRHLVATIPEDLNNVTDMEICQIMYNQERNKFRAALG